MLWCARAKFVTSLHMQEVAALAMENVNLRASEAHLRTAAAAASGISYTAAEDGSHASAPASVPLRDSAAAHESAVAQRVAAARRYAGAAKAADSSKGSAANAKVRIVGRWQHVGGPHQQTGLYQEEASSCCTAVTCRLFH
jgi:hypothetical protein